MTEITREGVGVKPFKVMTPGCAAKQSKGAFIPGCFFFIISFCGVKADKNPQISPEIPNVLLTSYT